MVCEYDMKCSVQREHKQTLLNGKIIKLYCTRWMAGFIIFRDGARAYFARKSCIPIHHIFFSYGFVCLYDNGDGVATGSVNMQAVLCVNVVFRVQTSFVKRIHIFSWVRADYTLVPQWSKSTTNYKYRKILFQICSVTSKVDSSSDFLTVFVLLNM